MKVFHASKYIIESPDVKYSRDLLDFGKGFYLTSLVEQAKKYAQRFLFQGEKANEICSHRTDFCQTNRHSIG